MKTAQISMEYLIVIGISLILLVPLGAIVNDYISYSKERISDQQIVEISRKIVDTARTVYFFGYPTKLKLKMYFPAGIESTEVMPHGIVFVLRTTNTEHDYFQYSEVNLSGKLTNVSGIHYVQVKAMPHYVNISIVK